MKFIEMDDTLRKINSLKNITSIKYHDLSSVTDNKSKIIPGFLVFYNGNNSLFLTVKDKYYQDFVKKLRSVYSNEQNSIITTDIMGNKKSIQIDDFTKKMLLDDKLEDDIIYSFYQDKEGYKNRLFFEMDEVKSILPIIKYHIEDTLKYFDYDIDLADEVQGYNGVYTINTIYNGIPSLVPLTFKKREFNSYELSIGGLFPKVMSLNMSIDILSSGITITSSIPEIKFNSTYIYEVNEDNAIMRSYAYLDNKLKSYKIDDLKVAKNKDDDIVLKNSGDSINWYLLPWNGLLGYTYSLDILTDNEKMIYYRLLYFDINEDRYTYIDTYAKKYHRDSTVLKEVANLTIDSVRKRTIGIKNNDIFLEETAFSDDGVTGFYKTNLANRYFYHITDRTKYISISKENGVLSSADLFRSKIRKLIKNGVDE